MINHPINGMNRVLMQHKIDKMNIHDRIALFFFHRDTPPLSQLEQTELDERSKPYSCYDKCIFLLHYFCCCLF